MSEPVSQSAIKESSSLSETDQLNTEDVSTVQSKAIAKRVKRVALVIVLGAIGSGVWSGVGAPLISWIAIGFIKTMSFVSSSYVDFLHKNIGKGLREEITIYLFELVALAGIWFFLDYGFLKPIDYYWRSYQAKHRAQPEDKKPEHEAIKLRRRRKLYLLILSPMCLISMIILFAGLVQLIYTNSAIVYIERSIEILSPYVSEQERLMLRSQFRSIHTARQFYDMRETLKSKSREKNVDIPSFDFME